MPTGLGRGFAEGKADSVAGDRVGEAQDGLGVGGFGGGKEPESLPAGAG